jgi:hypothetical protein
MYNPEDLQKIGGKPFGSGKGLRIYFNNLPELYGFTRIDRYNTGNISYAEVDGAKISNSSARGILTELQFAKVYYDYRHGSFHAQNIDKHSLGRIIKNIRELIKKHNFDDNFELNVDIKDIKDIKEFNGHELPQLEGSPKQIVWANDIRDEKIANEFNLLLLELKNGKYDEYLKEESDLSKSDENPQTVEEIKEMAIKFLMELALTKSASVWINKLRTKKFDIEDLLVESYRVYVQHKLNKYSSFKKQCQ